jgi:hypothetical protein
MSVPTLSRRTQRSSGAKRSAGIESASVMPTWATP